MSFLRSLLGSSEKGSSSKDLLGFDLLYQLTYLSSIAAAGIPRNQIFALAAELPCTTAVYFREVDQMVHAMKYQYSEACRMVGETAEHEEIRGLFLRMSSALASGEREKDFMQHEAEVQAELYGNEYERKMDTLQKWTDSYVALMVSVALIIVVASISTIIYDIGTSVITGMVLSMVLVSGLGAWVIYRTAPRELKTLNGPLGAASQRWSRRLFQALFPTATVLGSLALVMGVDPGWVLTGVGLGIIPVGVAGAVLDRAIGKRDMDMSAFMRALGTTATAMGTTPTEALGRMDLRSVNTLAKPVTRLETMLQARIAPPVCWERFVEDTGSELIRRGVQVFMGGISLGGDAEEVGARAAMLTMKVNLLRAKRSLVSSSFKFLSVAMHVVIVFLLLFILEVVDGFRTLIQSAGISDTAGGGGLAAEAALTFGFQNVVYLRELLVPVLIVLSVINAVAPKVTEGGYSHTIFGYVGMMFLATGMDMLVTPILARSIFNISASPI